MRMRRNLLGLAGLIVVAAAAGCGNSTPVVTTALTYTTDAADSAQVGGASQDESAAEPQAANPKPTGGTVPVAGEGYTAAVPSGWTKKSDWYDGKTSGTRFKWSNPSDPSVWVLIETTPGDGKSDLESATAVSANLTSPSVMPVSLAGDSDSAVIRFDRDGSRFDDYFLSPCSVGVAVEGSAPIGSFETWRSTFRSVADSVRC